MWGENAHTRWEMVMWGDFAKVYKGTFLKIFIICTLDITKVTSHPKSPHIHARQLCHLAWAQDDFGWKCVIVPSTMQKSPHMSILTSCDHSHLTSTSCLYGELSPPPCKSHLTWTFSSDMATVTLHPRCVPSCWVVPSTMQKSTHMTILTSCGNSHLISTLHAPLHTKIISFTSDGKIPKKVTQQPLFHQ